MEKKVSYNRCVIESLVAKKDQDLKERFLKPENETGKVSMKDEFNAILNTETEDGFYKFSSMASLSQASLEYVYGVIKEFNSRLKRATGRKLNLESVIDDVDLLFFKNIDILDASKEKDNEGVDLIVKEMLGDFVDNVLKKVAILAKGNNNTITV